MNTRPLTPSMKAFLQQAYEKQLNNEPPLSIYHSKSGKGLLQRGFVELKLYAGCEHPYLGYYVTPTGKEMLEKNGLVTSL